MKDQIKETLVKGKKTHYVKPLAIRIDDEQLDKSIDWNFNLRSGDHSQIQIFKKYDYFKLVIDSSSKHNRILPNGDKLIYYSTELKKIVDDNFIEELIGDLTTANN
jgi:hypothetical protein